jgi:PAS domain S-box-containing protein
MSISDKLKDHILDSIGEGVFTVDKNFRINYFNRAAENITGYNRDEVVGKFCKHIFKSELCYADCPIALVLKSNRNIYDYESRIYTKRGNSVPIKLNSAVLYNENDEPTGGIISFRDTSELEIYRKNIERETNYHGVIGHSKEMKDIFELIEEIVESDATVFIRGDSGTGKEMLANAIQKTSSRRDKPFIKINCSVFPPTLLASELFGHVKGAFTDAVKDRPGRFELADRGTLFLDEVAEMPLNMQLQLLRVLQEGTFERVGESITRKVDVRVVAATNINIEQALQEGKFREDLFYRLNVIPIEIPPLRERMDDLIPLVNHFLKKFSVIYKKEITEIGDKALETMLQYSWPGNIRELENVLEFAFVRTSQGNVIDHSKLPGKIKNNSQNGLKISENSSDLLDNERFKLVHLLETHHWNKTIVAQKLGIGRTTLWRKLKQLGID